MRIIGTVLDWDNRPVPGAKVYVQRTETDLPAQEQRATETGEYEFLFIEQFVGKIVVPAQVIPGLAISQGHAKIDSRGNDQSTYNVVVKTTVLDPFDLDGDGTVSIHDLTEAMKIRDEQIKQLAEGQIALHQLIWKLMMIVLEKINKK